MLGVKGEASTMPTEPDAVEPKMDPASLYHEETFTDRNMGMLRVLTPVTADGSPDITQQAL